MSIHDAPDRTTARPSPARGGVRLTPLTPRVMKMAVVFMLYFVLEIVGKLVALIQLVFVLVTHAPNPQINRFACGYSRWMGALWFFLTFAREDAPWPFSAWPGSSREGIADTRETSAVESM